MRKFKVLPIEFSCLLLLFSSTRANCLIKIELEYGIARLRTHRCFRKPVLSIGHRARSPRGQVSNFLINGKPPVARLAQKAGRNRKYTALKLSAIYLAGRRMANRIVNFRSLLWLLPLSPFREVETWTATIFQKLY